MLKRFADVAGRLLEQPLFRLMIRDGEAVAAMAWDRMSWLGALWAPNMDEGVFSEENGWAAPVSLTIPKGVGEPVRVEAGRDGLEILWGGPLPIRTSTPWLDRFPDPPGMGRPLPSQPVLRIRSGASLAFAIAGGASDFDDLTIPGMAALPEGPSLVGISRYCLIRCALDAEGPDRPLPIPEAVFRMASAAAFHALEIAEDEGSLVVRAGDLILRTPADGRMLPVASIREIMRRAAEGPAEASAVLPAAFADHLRPHMAILGAAGPDAAVSVRIGPDGVRLMAPAFQLDPVASSRSAFPAATDGSGRAFLSEKHLRLIVAFMSRAMAETAELRISGPLVAIRTDRRDIVVSSLIPPAGGSHEDSSDE